MKLRKWTIIRRNDDGTWSETGRKFWTYRNARKARRWHNTFGQAGTMGGQLEQLFYGPRFVIWDRNIPVPSDTRSYRNALDPAEVPVL